MDGFVTDYISTFTGEVGRQPTYDEYAQIMTGYTPEQLPVLNGLARGFGVFDHWFCEVPSQTFMNRSFWTAATSSGLVVNSPATKWLTENNAETIFERLEAHGKTWKVYVVEPMPLSFTGVIHYPRLKDRLATHFVPFAEFEKDAAAGTLPDFSLIEPRHGRRATATTTRPWAGRSSATASTSGSTPRRRCSAARRSWRGSTTPTGRCTSPTGCQRLEHRPADRLGRARRHLRPRPARPGAAARSGCSGGRVRLHLRPLRLPGPGHHGLPLGRAGVGVQRGVPAHLADRHAAGAWDLGDPFTARDAAARIFSDVFTLDAPRDPDTWPVPNSPGAPFAWMTRPRRGPLRSWARPSSTESGATQEKNIELEGLPDDPKADIPPENVVTVLRSALPSSSHSWLLPLRVSQECPNKPSRIHNDPAPHRRLGGAARHFPARGRGSIWLSPPLHRDRCRARPISPLARIHFLRPGSLHGRSTGTRRRRPLAAFR